MTFDPVDPKYQSIGENMYRTAIKRLLVAGMTLCGIAALGLWEQPAAAQGRFAGEPGWYPYVIARGTDRSQIESTPIHQRPYRPLHFYGNTVRRNYYRNNPMPLPRDMVRTVVVPIRRRQIGSN